MKYYNLWTKIAPLTQYVHKHTAGGIKIATLGCSKCHKHQTHWTMPNKEHECRYLANVGYSFGWSYGRSISYTYIVSERRREKRCEASRRSTQRASCYSHMGQQNNKMAREILMSAMWFIERKVILFRCRTDIRDEPARPGDYAVWRFISQMR